MPRAIMLQGTGSDVGKSVLVAGLCRAAKLRGMSVRPFKPQNMSNNAAVATIPGEGREGEIGRAQWLQALACGVEPTVHMNPVLLKPQGATGAQIIVQGKVFGSAKAAQLHLSRLLAAELGPDKIRVNSVNPDAVIAGSNIWSGGWAEGRAKAYGVAVEDLPAYYAKRTLLNEVILPEDIANACFALVSGLLNKSTGNVLNVDGGIAASFVR